MRMSVIIPTHNTKLHELKRCLDSIEENKFPQLEVIIIDDNSENNYFENYQRIIRKYSFLVILKKNRGIGVSSARNTGLRLCQGEYVTFVDSDDTVPSYFFMDAFRKLKEYKLDAVYGGFTEVYGSYQKEICNLGHSKIIEEPKIYEVQQSMFGLKNRSFSKNLPFIVGGRVIKRDIVPGFEESLRISEDQIWNYDILENAHRIGVFPESWYNYYQHADSTGHISQKDYIKNRLPFWLALKSRVKKNNSLSYMKIYYSKAFIDIKNSVYYGAIKNNFYDFKKEILSGLSYKETQNILENINLYLALSLRNSCYIYLLKNRHLLLLYLIMNRKEFLKSVSKSNNFFYCSL